MEGCFEEGGLPLRIGAIQSVSPDAVTYHLLGSPAYLA
jgi:hypothetical protein